MDFSGNRIIKIAITLLLLCCMFFANFYAVRMRLRHGVDVYFYDKLLVAYNIGGMPGLKIELEKIRANDGVRRETILADDFAFRLATLNDPEAFLNAKVSQNKKMIYLIRSLRSAAIGLMTVVFAWQFIVNFIARRKSKGGKQDG